MRTIRTLAVALLASAALAGPAAAMPTDPPHQPALPPIVQNASPSPATSSGFDWSSAAIGAVGGIGAFAIALAITGGLRRRRLPKPRYVVPLVAAVALVASAAWAMPGGDPVAPVAHHARHSTAPGRADAAAHAAIVRALGAARMAEARR